MAELRVSSAGAIGAVPHRGYPGAAAFTAVAPGPTPAVHDAEAGSAIRLDAAAGEPFGIEIHAAGRRVGRVGRAAGESSVVIERSGHDPDVLAGDDPAAGTGVFLDADILEVFTAGGYGAWRI